MLKHYKKEDAPDEPSPLIWIDPTREYTTSEDSVLLRDMFIYIENNVNRPCTLHDLAAELKYNESYLSRIFVKDVGIPYSEYVRSVKINHACYLLKNTDDSVNLISEKCGYATQSSFNRSFKQFTGINPLEYRNTWKTSINS